MSKSESMDADTNLDVRSEFLAKSIRRATHLLPAQGPIGVFIHHNTLHAYEHLTFDDAVRSGARVFGCEPYLTEDRYREELAKGSILFGELREVLRSDLGKRADEVLHGLCTRWELRIAMLEHPLRMGDGAELDWLMAESDSLNRSRADVSDVLRRRLLTSTRHWVMSRLRSTLNDAPRPAWAEKLFTQNQSTRIEDWTDRQWESFTLSALWETCVAGVSHADQRIVNQTPMVRHRDFLLAALGEDTDLLVHELLIRFCGAFVDQGIAQSDLPGYEQGFLQSFISLYSTGIAPAWWADELRADLIRIRNLGLTPLEIISETLVLLGVEDEEVDLFIPATLLALRGWAGIIWHVEQRADRVHKAFPQGSLVEFLSVRLILEKHAIQAVAKQSSACLGTLSGLRSALADRTRSKPFDRLKQRAFLVFQLAQVLGWSPESLDRLSPAEWTSLMSEIESFDDFERRRVFHLGYEHRFRVQTLDALDRPITPSLVNRPSFQALFCIDEREESIRRHLEEVAPDCETYGAAGFFGVIMYYRSAASADFIPLCPVVVRPSHWVSERVDDLHANEAARRKSRRRRIGMALHGFHRGSRRIMSGAFLSASLGLLSTVPLVARVLFPRLTARLGGYLGSFVDPPPATRLTLERATESPGSAESAHGFTIAEMSNIAERLLCDIGLTHRHSRLIFIFGHGSTSMNNPHESAHDCGACGGGRGGPNARAVAHILNDVRVRANLSAKGIPIPDDTYFVGGIHNTASDDFRFYDVDRVPATHRVEYEKACTALHEAASRNAHERARRFNSASLSLTQAEAKKHMEGRAEDLSQVRPEWGHATNAICVVGRRERTRGLFLDRRSFLVSYDASQDNEQYSIIARILGAVVPVCSGINLEYYFSHVDSLGWGAGSKLPHNIVGLISVMDGSQSDLRTGLPWQMVEIHEPVRLLFVVEATEAALLAVMNANLAIRNLVANRWVQLAAMNPETGSLTLYREGTFIPHIRSSARLPTAASSREWYTGCREHLEFAEIGSNT